MTDRIEEHHPSFGIIRVHRCMGGNMELFGSKVFHNRVLEVEVCKASLIVEGQREHPHAPAGGNIVRFFLSETQWGQFVSGLGRAEGVPVTLATLNGEHVPRLTGQVSNRQRSDSEFKKTCKKAVTQVDEIIVDIHRLTQSGKATKNQLDAIQARLLEFRNLLPVNLDYLLKTFEEETEKIVQEAKRSAADHHTTSARLPLPESQEGETRRRRLFSLINELGDDSTPFETRLDAYVQSLEGCPESQAAELASNLLKVLEDIKDRTSIGGDYV